MEAPSEGRQGHGASVYLLDLSPQLASRGAVRPPLQLWLRYLVTTWAEDPAAANRLLVDLAYAALEQMDLEIEPQPLPAETWTALKTVAKPSFVMRVMVRRARAQPVAGIVRGPGGIALAGASVALPSVGRETTTDGRGRFVFAGVPGPPLSTSLVIRAKGTETIVKLPKDPARARALVIEISSLEGANA